MIVHSAQAGGAAFSQDGKKVYSVENAGEFVVLDLEKATSEPVSPARLPKDSEMQDVDRAKDGSLLLLTEEGLWKWKGGKEGVDRLWKAPASVRFFNVAVNPVNGEILILGGFKAKGENGYYGLKLYWWEAGRKEPEEVHCRRVNEIQCIAFTMNGELLFSSQGDLWLGGIDGSEVRRDLTGDRILPLATLETYGGTPNGEGIRDLAAAGRFVYARISRLYGSGWSEGMVQFELPKKEGAAKPDGAAPENESSWERTAKLMLTVKSIAGDGDGLCTSPDGKTVHFYTRESSASSPERHRLMEDEADPNPGNLSQWARWHAGEAGGKENAAKKSEIRKQK
ncbi:MAG TPA: hypothetical protein VHM91_06660 [Verrucomicrobiales bacterium]|nr:hypothetical protein [Verrucomicrobiales bacterium]